MKEIELKIKEPMVFCRDYIHMLRDKGHDIKEHDRVLLESYMKALLKQYE